MRITAAVLRGADQPYRLENVELIGPGPGEVLVEVVGTGLCHTDIALRSPALALLLPVVPGMRARGACGWSGQMRSVSGPATKSCRRSTPAVAVVAAVAGVPPTVRSSSRAICGDVVKPVLLTESAAVHP